MARYRKVDLRIHSDEKYRNLSKPQPCGQYLFLYLLIGPHTGPIPGLFRLSLATLADELGWNGSETVSKPFQELFRKGMVKADFEAKLVWLPNALKYNPPANPNVVKGWAKAWDELPECPLKDEAYHAFKAFLSDYPGPYRNGFETVPKPLVEPFRKQEQEQEQEQDIDTCQTCEPDGSNVTDGIEGSPKVDRDDIQETWLHYRTHHPKATRVLLPGRKEYRLIRQRLQEFGVDDLKGSIDGYHRSPFHCGENDAKKKYLSVELIMRDASHVQAGLEMLDASTNGGGKPRSLLDYRLDGDDTAN